MTKVWDPNQRPISFNALNINKDEFESAATPKLNDSVPIKGACYTEKNLCERYFQISRCPCKTLYRDYIELPYSF